MQDKLKVAVIGLGMGKGHVRRYQANKNAEVIAICDIDSERLQSVAVTYNIPKTFTDIDNMFKEVPLDAVSIALPNKLHNPVTLKALKAGYHVLCEKPMAMNANEAAVMLETAKQCKKNLMINFSQRFTEMGYALKSQVENDVIGKVYFGRTVWHRRRGIPGFGGWFTNLELAGGGPLIDLGVHRLDLALWLMGYPEPLSVSGSIYDVLAKKQAKAENKSYTVEDLACGLIKFTNGATLILEASWAANISQGEEMITQLSGTNGGILQKRNFNEGTVVGEIYTEENGYLFTKKVDRSTVPVPSSMDEFISSILEKRKPIASGDEGVKVMKILDGLYRSAKEGKEIRL